MLIHDCHAQGMDLTKSAHEKKGLHRFSYTFVSFLDI